MKKLFFLFAITALLSACSASDISDVETGMSGEEVIDIAGEPSERVSMPLNIEWWIYKEDNVLLIMDNNTVSQVTSEQKLEESLKKMEDGMNEIENKVNELTE